MLKIGIIYGGESTEHEVSIKSAESIIENIDKEKYIVERLYIDEEGTWFLNGKELKNVFSYLKTLDLAFPVLHGQYGEDGSITGLFTMASVPYIGCSILSNALAMDKVYSKIIFKNAHIEVAPYIYIKQIGYDYYYINDMFEEKRISIKDLSKLIKDKLNYPVYIKPSRSGSSIGITKCKEEKELLSSLEEASKYDNKILIEKSIVGRELECAVLGNNDIVCSKVGEIITNNDFYSYDAKYINSFNTSLATLPKDIEEEIKALAIRAYKSLDCKGLSRVDFFLEENTNKIIINEINTMPGFTNISMYPKLWENTGLSYKELINKLIFLALENDED